MVLIGWIVAFVLALLSLVFKWPTFLIAGIVLAAYLIFSERFYDGR